MNKLPADATFEYKNINGFTYTAPKGTEDWSLIGRMITIEDHKFEEEITKIKSYIFEDPTQYKKKLSDFILWTRVLEISENNSSLQEAMERVKSIYYMTVKNDT
jgi:hypothetical protein